MGQWVVTVAGIAILSVLCDVILPEGQTRKYVKTVFGVVVTLAIVQPLIGLFAESNWSVGSGSIDDVQQQYLESVDARHNRNAADSVKQLLEYKNISVGKITVSESDKTVLIQLEETYSKQYEDIINVVANSYFPDFELITVWK